MEVLYKNEIEEINNSGYLNKSLTITEALIENFYNDILVSDDKQLLKLAFSKNPKQEELNNLLKIWDIETKDAGKCLLMAYFLKQHPHLKFTSYEEPRLKGLLNFFRFKNLKTIAHFTKIGRELNKNGIEPMILKGGAMKWLRPELPRLMNDIDVLVPEKDFMKSADIICSLGYSYEKIDIHSIDFHPKAEGETQEGAVDLHKFIYMGTGFEKNYISELYKRANFKMIFGVKTLIPSNEDMVFITLINLAKNLRDKTSQHGIVFTLFDCKFLLETTSDFNWNIVKENAKITNTEVQLNFAIKFIDKISNEVLPSEIKTNMPFEKETNRYSNMVMYNRFYLESIRKECREMKIKNIIKTPEKWWRYLSLKPKYLFLKSFRKHPLLIELFIGSKILKEVKNAN